MGSTDKQKRKTLTQMAAGDTTVGSRPISLRGEPMCRSDQFFPSMHSTGPLQIFWRDRLSGDLEIVVRNGWVTDHALQIAASK
jgi:hypothetical protein